MSDSAIQLDHVGKMYKLYRRQSDKVLDALGVARFLPWHRNNHREFWALRDLNLSVRRGERLGIIGRNGAGKSTLLKIITGNIAITEGTLRVAGRVQALLELGTGFHPEFTGRQNIHASLSYQGLSAAAIRAKEEEIIDFAELEDFIEQPVKTYSAGMYARLAFSTATAIEPEVLIIDEVLGAGDAYFAGKCVERMKRLTEQSGATVLFVSHDLGSVQQLCERVIWIDRGRISMDGEPLDVTKAYYASILAQEELRLRARNARLNRRQLSVLKSREEAEHIKELLFRLVPASGAAPRYAHPIRRIVLRKDPDYREEIAPGAPMDNDAAQSCYLLTDKQYMLWGDPAMSDGQRVRCVTATGGVYGHAPFVFAVPLHVWDKDEFVLEITHAAEPGDTISIEVFSNDAYEPIGTLAASPRKWTTESFPVCPQRVVKSGPEEYPREVDESVRTNSRVGHMPQSAIDAAAVILKQRERDKFYSDAADFRRIQTTDEAGHASVIYRPGQTIGVAIEFDVFRDVPVCELALSMYTIGDVVIGTMMWPLHGGVTAGRHRVAVFIEEPNLRQGTYLLSCALIRERGESSNENIVYFCRWNRALTFRIDEGFVGSAPLGLVRLNTRPPARVALKTTRLDAALPANVSEPAPVHSG